MINVQLITHSLQIHGLKTLSFTDLFSITLQECDVFVLISWPTWPSTSALQLGRSPSVHTGSSMLTVKKLKSVGVNMT